MLLSVQPFSMGQNGGGRRILASLFRDPPIPVHSIAVTNEHCDPGIFAETTISPRPSFGRLQRTRLNHLFSPLDYLLLARTKSAIIREAHARGAKAIHTVSHNFPFIAAAQAAAKLEIPLFLSVHDDSSYDLKDSIFLPQALQHLKRIWNQAEARYVISQEMGEEYSSRYGAREFEIVTDGLTRVSEIRASRPGSLKTIYFMGLLHNSYYANFESLCRAFGSINPLGNERYRLKIRAGRDSLPFDTGGAEIELLPFGSQEDVEKDMNDADLLYLPLPFGSEYVSFVKFSMSTKLVSYLGSGLPILYHGPADSAACKLLRRHEACLVVESSEPDQITPVLKSSAQEWSDITANALALAKEQFMLEDQRKRFWSPIVGRVG